MAAERRLTAETLHTPVHENMRTDFVQLHQDLTVAEALDQILERQPEGRIIYFYVTDADGRLKGVVPTRRLLLSPREKTLAEVLISPVIAIPRDATVLDACEFFTIHKLLAFPVVDQDRRIVGIVDVDLYTRELSDLDRWESQNDLFQLIGVQITEAQHRSVPALFRRRFPWLLATLAGGLVAAVVADFNYNVATLAVIVPFIPLVLALSSSVASQSASLALQTIHGQRPSWTVLRPKIKYELAIGALLGLGCGLIAGLVVLTWKGDPAMALCLLASLTAGVACAAVIGLGLPYFLRILNRNIQVAAGPIALATADVVSLIVYFSLARWLLA